jgi:hypothetical protein
MNRPKTCRPNAADIIEAIRGGATLLRSFERPRTRWWLSDGRDVSAEAAEQAILHSDITPAGDGLFPHGPAQTYRAAQ